jgi:protease-4
MRFLSNVLSTIVGIFLFFIGFLFLFLIIGMFMGGDEGKSVDSDSVINLDLSKVALDYSGKINDPFLEALGETEKVGFVDILNAIQNAKTDENIKGISMLNTTSNLGIAQLQELRKKLLEFKKTGKFIVSYSDIMSQSDYYLASIADSIYLNPSGEMSIKGIGSEMLYLKDFQEKIGVKMEVIRHGKYKSAVEPFLANEISPENKEQMLSFFNSIWNDISTEIASSRKISIEQLNLIATNLDARTPKLALKNKLIDKIGYEDQYHAGIKKALKVAQDEDYNTIDIVDYANNLLLSPKDNDAKDKIAIIYAQGEIMGGKGDVNIIGEGAMRTALQDARADEDIKAIVLRVNSPGGSALTSELIWRELELTKKVKPIVVSMGNYAASGGYYIACNANKIIAEPTTITGSIGVFGMLPNAKALSDRYGINAQHVETHENAIDYSLFKAPDEKFIATVTESIEQVYQTFITRVANGRKMTLAQVDALAQGRVYSGREALKVGLVDQLGSLDTALIEAAKLAKLKKYKTVELPYYDKDFEDFLEDGPLAKIKNNWLIDELGEENYKILQEVKKQTQIKGVQVRMPYIIEFK